MLEVSTHSYDEVLKLLYVFSFSLGLWTCLNMLVNKLGPRDVRHSLMLFILVLLIVPVNGYLGMVLEEPTNILDSIASNLTWCYGPLILILVNSVIHQRRSPLFALLHFLPFASITAMHLLNLDWWGFRFYLPMLLVQVAIYLSLALSLLFRQRRRVLVLGKEFKNSAYYWMLYLIAGVFVLVVYDSSLMFALYMGAKLNFYFVSTTACAFSVYISTISIFLLMQPNIFEKAPPQDSQEHAVVEDEETVRPQKLRYVELSSDAAHELELKLQQLIKEHKPHLDADISLAKLASLLGVTTHQLSELLNIHLETNFYDFLNALRYKEAVRLMTEHPGSYSITDIAYLAGFNNRNSFYKVFRKYEGVTPGEYRKQCAQTG